MSYDEFNNFFFLDPCLVHYCGQGEECVALGGVARCICVRKCGQAKRRVCGTNGQLYGNRCELHKASCLTGVNIEIDHSLKCFIPSGEFKIKNKHQMEIVIFRLILIHSCWSYININSSYPRF